MQRWEMEFSKGWWGREYKKNEVLCTLLNQIFFSNMELYELFMYFGY